MGASLGLSPQLLGDISLVLFSFIIVGFFKVKLGTLNPYNNRAENNATNLFPAPKKQRENNINLKTPLYRSGPYSISSAKTSATTKVLPPMNIISSAVAISKAR